MSIDIHITPDQELIEIGKLAYGTFVMGVHGQGDSVYMKVNKKNIGQGIRLEFIGQERCSLLMNVKLGTLRVVSRDTLVSVYDAALHLMKRDIYKDKK